jgi:hypothetical protein
VIGVFSGGVSPPVEFRVEYGKVEGMIAGAPAEPSSSSLDAKALDEMRPSVIELHKYFCEVVGVWFMGLVIRVPPSQHVWVRAGFEIVREFSFFFSVMPDVASQSETLGLSKVSKRGEVEVVQCRGQF